MDLDTETLWIAAIKRQASLGAGELVGANERLNFEGTVSTFDGHARRGVGFGWIEFVRGWKIESKLKDRIWKRVGVEPSDTLGSLSHPEDAEYYCFCNIGVTEDQFDRLVAETRIIKGHSVEIECALHFIAREATEWDEPLKHGLYPIVGWNVVTTNHSAQKKEPNSLWN
jgi:hypothetical protein